MAEHSVLIAADDTAQDAAGFDPSRRALSVYADEGNTDDGWIRFGIDATQARPSIRVKPGDTHNFDSGWKDLIVRRISIIGKQNDQFTLISSGY